MPEEAQALLELDGLTVALPAWADRPHAVADVSLGLGRDEILCVVGESGSGKSVMARSIMGLLPQPHVRPVAGRILFEGEDLLKASPARMRQIRGSRIAMIFQEPMTALNPLMTIGRQIEEMIEVHIDMPRPARRVRILELLDDVRLPDPESLLRVYPHELSGGQRQRAMIAMALVLEPAILIADEPTTALDVTTQAQILALIKELQRKHHTGVLFITHDFGVVAEIADRVAVMQHGRLVEIGEADRVLNAPAHPYARALIAAVPSLVPRLARAPTDEPVLLRTQALEKVYRGRGTGLLGRTPGRQVHAVKSVDLAVRRGRTLGLVGESGSGKSTLARCIIRLIEPDGGGVWLGDTEFTALSRRQLRPYRKRIQMVFQDPYGSLNPRLRVAELVAQGPIVHGTPEREALASARELLELVGLDPRAADRFPHEFSGGQRQRIGIARALALRPEVLIADEPVSALDVSVQAQVLQLLADIRDRFQLTMLFITHDLRVAAQVCDDIAVMRYGEIVEQGPTAAVFAAPAHPYTQELLAAVPGRDWIAHARTASPDPAQSLVQS
jgi:peptide/nickel transport system ATP-binding protein